jgi:homogentisate 1,2-dioxygenase
MIINYQSGFGNHFATEAIEGALPLTQNAPQKPAFGLYAEQLSGTAFTALRHQNYNSWLYRIRPSVLHCGEPELVDNHLIRDQYHHDAILTPPQQFRWDPIPLPNQPTAFPQGLTTMAYNQGGAIHLYAINESMTDSFFYNADGDLLFILQQGDIRFKTELGIIEATVGDIVVMPRGIRFQVLLSDDHASGYIAENQAAPFVLPERGPIGANGLAEERHFKVPVAFYEESSGDFTLYVKSTGHLWRQAISHSPCDVVAWHGNYAPYKYNLRDFIPMFSALKDHADPSIFTVLTSPSERMGIANMDFVIFPERWMVAENTFRPPYYHRNVMSEFMGLIYGQYDAKEQGFVPGGCSLHNPMSGHGVDSDAFNKASAAQNEPIRYQDTLAFMLESHCPWRLTEFALNTPQRQTNYIDCWQGLGSHFSLSPDYKESSKCPS